MLDAPAEATEESELSWEDAAAVMDEATDEMLAESWEAEREAAGVVLCDDWALDEEAEACRAAMWKAGDDARRGPGLRARLEVERREMM